MKCIFAFIEDSEKAGWFLVSKETKLNIVDLRFFIQCYGIENIKLRCGDFDFDKYGYDSEF